MSTSGVAQQPEKTEDLSLEEISTKYAGRWVALTVTARDKNLQPVRGIVVADEVDRYRLRAHFLFLRQAQECETLSATRCKLGCSPLRDRRPRLRQESIDP